MTSNIFSGNLLVDARFVVHEVFIDLEAHHHRTIFPQLPLDFLSRRQHFQRSDRTIKLLPGNSWVVTAIAASVGMASVLLALISHHAIYLEVVDCGCEIPAQTGKVLEITVDHFLGRKAVSDFAL